MQRGPQPVRIMRTRLLLSGERCFPDPDGCTGDLRPREVHRGRWIVKHRIDADPRVPERFKVLTARKRARLARLAGEIADPYDLRRGRRQRGLHLGERGDGEHACEQRARAEQDKVRARDGIDRARRDLWPRRAESKPVDARRRGADGRLAEQQLILGDTDQRHLPESRADHPATCTELGAQRVDRRLQIAGESVGHATDEQVPHRVGNKRAIRDALGQSCRERAVAAQRNERTPKVTDCGAAHAAPQLA
jgi:hypothetical protein